MYLIQAQIHQFRSFIRPQTLTIDPYITWIVGKSDSGKTALLQALARSLPLEATADIRQHPNATAQGPAILTSTFDPGKDIPRSAYQLEDFAATGTPQEAVTLTFQLTSLEKRQIEAECAPDTVPAHQFSVTFYFNSPATSTLPTPIFEYLSPLIPRFIVLDQPQTIPTRIDLNRTPPVVKAFCNSFNLNLDQLGPDTNADTVNHVLQSAAHQLNHLIARYWYQHKKLELFFSPKKMLLTIFVTNPKHQDRRPLDQESSGFCHLVSFLLHVWPCVKTHHLAPDLATDATDQFTAPAYILLLDEPTTYFDVSGQKGLIRFLQLQISTQVIYATKSPFMIDSLTFHQGRTIYNSYNASVGTYLSDKLRRVGWRAVFPLQTL